MSLHKILFLCCLSLPAYAVLFEKDDRQELYELKDPDLRKQAQSVGAIFHQSDLEQNNIDSDLIKLKTQTFRDRAKLCPSERFGSQPSAPVVCSGILVSPKRFVTSKFCLERVRCEDLRVVFGYAYEKASSTPTKIRKKDIYSCKRVLKLDFPEKMLETAWMYTGVQIELDRPVTDRQPVLYDTRPEKLMYRPQDDLIAVGYPYGLPLKIVNNARITSSTQTTGGLSLFFTELDVVDHAEKPSFVGGPLLSRHTKKAIALYESNAHYKSLELAGSCYQAIQCGDCSEKYPTLHADYTYWIKNYPPQTIKRKVGLHFEKIDFEDGKTVAYPIETKIAGRILDQPYSYSMSYPSACSKTPGLCEITLRHPDGSARTIFRSGESIFSNKFFSGKPFLGNWQIELTDTVADGKSPGQIPSLSITFGVEQNYDDYLFRNMN